MFRLSLRWNNLAVVACAAGLAAVVLVMLHGSTPAPREKEKEPARLDYKRRQVLDTSRFLAIYADHQQPSWANAASLEEVAAAHRQHISSWLTALDEMQATRSAPIDKVLLKKASLLHSEGKATEAYQVLKA